MMVHRIVAIGVSYLYVLKHSVNCLLYRICMLLEQMVWFRVFV